MYYRENMPNNNDPQHNLSEFSLHKQSLPDRYFSSDDLFNGIYPSSVKVLARKHWTPLGVAKKAARFLAADAGCRILDVGSGVGKFCLTGAFFNPGAFYYGVEQRRNLVDLSSTIATDLHIENVYFSHGNFTQVDFKGFDHFYFYNSFYENLTGTDKIDDTIEYSSELYYYYTRYLFRQLDRRPAGTRLATFHSSGDEIPSEYNEVASDFDNQLKFWIKI